jgi:stearoyl-CoA desaturase (delta-9 desaturase)
MRPVDDPHAVGSVVLQGGEDAVAGRVVWDPAYSLWNGGMMAAALVFGPATASPSAFAVFVLLTGATLLLGHSVGFHRLMIHGAFACPVAVMRVLAVFGTAVGMTGPLTMIRWHDLRDWAQRQPDCHPYLAHRRPMLIGGWHQLHCRLVLDRPPRFEPPPALADDPVLRALERHWMLLQLPIALVLFTAGGWSWVVWGVCVRVCVSVTGHWFVGHLAHRCGAQTWRVATSGVQGFDVPWAAVFTMGEAWHNNHHAFPASARLGLLPGQSDWAWRFIQLLERVGLAWDVRTPESLPLRAALTRLSKGGSGHEFPRDPGRG